MRISDWSSDVCSSDLSYLTEELVRQGHDVTLFASGDSETSAELVPCCEVALRLDPAVRDHVPYHMMMLEQVRRRADEFDVLHFHIDLLQFPLIRDFADRTVTTLHGRFDLPDPCPFTRSEEPTHDFKYLMPNSNPYFCLNT